MGFVLDGYTFSIDIIDYKKKIVRSLRLDNATNFDDEVPKAQEIVNLGLKLISFDDSVNVDQKCNDSLPQIFVKMKTNSKQDSTKQEKRKPKRRRATKR